MLIIWNSQPIRKEQLKNFPELLRAFVKIDIFDESSGDSEDTFELLSPVSESPGSDLEGFSDGIWLDDTISQSNEWFFKTS